MALFRRKRTSNLISEIRKNQRRRQEVSEAFKERPKVGTDRSRRLGKAFGTVATFSTSAAQSFAAQQRSKNVRSKNVKSRSITKAARKAKKTKIGQQPIMISLGAPSQQRDAPVRRRKRRRVKAESGSSDPFEFGL